MRSEILIKAFIIWIILWVPISFLFQSNPHVGILFAITAPLGGFIWIFMPGAWSDNAFSEATLPWLIFWLMYFFIIISVDEHIKSKNIYKNDK